jgi:hypothetical protein
MIPFASILTATAYATIAFFAAKAKNPDLAKPFAEA